MIQIYKNFLKRDKEIKNRNLIFLHNPKFCIIFSKNIGKKYVDKFYKKVIKNKKDPRVIKEYKKILLCSLQIAKLEINEQLRN